jgi:hypothetical protein
MSADRDPLAAPYSPILAVSLHCRTCGKSEEQTVGGVFEFLVGGPWPKCCGEVMAIHLKMRSTGILPDDETLPGVV